MTMVSETKQSKNKPKSVRQCFLRSAEQVFLDFSANVEKYIETNYCLDAIVASFSINNGEIEKHKAWWFKGEERKKQYKKQRHIKKLMFPDEWNLGEDMQTVIVVLESPHKDEYCKNGLRMPAMGITGANLDMYFKDILNLTIKTNRDLFNSFKYPMYRVILMNAIQYQCSLGQKTNGSSFCFRDRMFTKMWGKSEDSIVQRDFIKRLMQYKPDIIFNFCTAIGNNGVRDLILATIKYKKLPRLKLLYKAYHPVCWSFRKDSHEVFNVLRQGPKDNNDYKNILQNLKKSLGYEKCKIK